MQNLIRGTLSFIFAFPVYRFTLGVYFNCVARITQKQLITGGR